MPLFYQHNIDHSTKLAIWHIIETEDFFLNKVSIQNNITHWHKRLQHLAGRYLLQELYPDFPYHLMEIADTKKPFLPNEKYFFSISHCGDYAAVIVSKKNRVGVDIELVNPKIELIKHKFLNEKEFLLPEKNNLQQLTLLWSCKEAVFKWYGNGGIDFKKQIILKKISVNDDQGVVDCLFVKDEETSLKVNFNFFDNLCLVWILS